MGCYGVGPSRVMGSIVEVYHDDRGMVWPKAIAPFVVHLISLSSKDETVQETMSEACESLTRDLESRGIDVLWDDRDARAGEKFADADLIGIPLRLVVSEKTLKENFIEWKERHETDVRLVGLTDVLDEVEQLVHAPDRLTRH